MKWIIEMPEGIKMNEAVCATCLLKDDVPHCGVPHFADCPLANATLYEANRDEGIKGVIHWTESPTPSRKDELVKRLRAWEHSYKYRPLTSATALMKEFAGILSEFEKGDK